jgi:hypothetical protein
MLRNDDVQYFFQFITEVLPIKASIKGLLHMPGVDAFAIVLKSMPYRRNQIDSINVKTFIS